MLRLAFSRFFFAFSCERPCFSPAPCLFAVAFSVVAPASCRLSCFGRCLHLKSEIYNLKFPSAAPMQFSSVVFSLRHCNAALHSPILAASTRHRSLSRRPVRLNTTPPTALISPYAESPVLGPTVHVLHIRPVEFFSATVLRSFMAHDDKSKNKSKNRTHRATRFHRATPTLAPHSSLC